MFRKIFFKVVCFSVFYVASAFANPDNVVVDGNLKITGLGNGLEFPDGSVQNTASSTGMFGGATTTIVFCHDVYQCNCPSGQIVKSLAKILCDDAAALQESSIVENNPGAWEARCITLITLSKIPPTSIFLACTSP
jgi:hypothetical protein